MQPSKLILFLFVVSMTYILSGAVGIGTILVGTLLHAQPLNIVLFSYLTVSCISMCIMWVLARTINHVPNYIPKPVQPIKRTKHGLL